VLTSFALAAVGAGFADAVGDAAGDGETGLLAAVGTGHADPYAAAGSA
jgi:hypothetical protein